MSPFFSKPGMYVPVTRYRLINRLMDTNGDNEDLVIFPRG